MRMTWRGLHIEDITASGVALEFLCSLKFELILRLCKAYAYRGIFLLVSLKDIWSFQVYKISIVTASENQLEF